MSGPTSVPLATVILVLLPFDVVTWVLRFYVRLSRKAWGPDDWSMVIAIPLFIISTIGMTGIAFTGGGKMDLELTTEQRETAMFWWFIMQTMFCLAAIPVKWAICFTLLRIAENRRAYQISIWIVMAMVFLVMASTTVYDPVPLLWNVQIDIRVKCSIIALLGLGIFASTAAIVRLTVTVNLSAKKDFLYYAMPVAAWAHAELGLGVILANLPALRPLLEKILNLRSTLGSGGKRSRYTDPKSSDNYLELGERTRKSTHKSTTVGSSKGTETRIYGGDLADSNSTLGDDRSTKQIVRNEGREDTTGIQVDHQIRITHVDAKP
ncbi:hypothetical protein N0V86_003342 [Didymella sp. IMI 355093]|nr:hypothetical protein N0V86_003342 [Didymella sp. IMI 355093]